MKKIIHTLILLAVASISANAQQENTMYMMDRIPYASTLNPALTPDCKWYLGGLLMPLTGQIPPSMYMSLTTPFAYEDLIYKEKTSAGYFKTALSDSASFSKFKGQLHDQNLLSFETELPMLMFGFRSNNTYWTFSMTEKVRLNAIIPKDFLIFPIEGNGALQDADFSGLAINATAYREYALGFRQQVNKYFKVGARLKFLSGYYNIYTEQSELKLITDPENSSITAQANMIVNTSLPIIDSVGYNAEGNVDEVYTRDAPTQEELMQTFTFSKNWGVALDFGLAKDFNSEITMYASVVDLGYINWIADPYAFIFKGEQELTGVKIDSLSFVDDLAGYDPTDYINEMFSDYKYTSTKSEYTEWLPFKCYLGADYKLRKWVKLGALYRGEYLSNKLYNAYTLSLNFRYMKFSSTSISYTIKNGNYANIGFGTSFRMGPFNTFFVTDNIALPLLWYKAELVSFRMGTSLVFGVQDKRKSRKSVPLLDLY